MRYINLRFTYFLLTFYCRERDVKILQRRCSQFATSVSTWTFDTVAE